MAGIKVKCVQIGEDVAIKHTALATGGAAVQLNKDGAASAKAEFPMRNSNNTGNEGIITISTVQQGDVLLVELRPDLAKVSMENELETVLGNSTLTTNADGSLFGNLVRHSQAICGNAVVTVPFQPERCSQAI
ncbi:hypothetical protein HPP92_021420 [Vanilla planifolia]|uniref:Uncharacterized protein n=1 Tax=Vanilla planifolia TaxID=51239 RepID=A0A835Q4K4_VANPL|nr:hypothetical protein HPP92_021420 [Vanilla planifolia]